MERVYRLTGLLAAIFICGLFLMEFNFIHGSRTSLGLLKLGFFVALAAHHYFAWKLGKLKSSSESSPRNSGTLVVLGTGFAAAVFFALAGADFWLIVSLSILSLGIASGVYLFASRHEKDVGEARFQTGENDQ